MEAWPITVPSIALSGSMKGKPFRAPLETDMEDGQKRRRRSTTKNIATYSYTLRMSNAEFATFQAWVRDDLVDGILQFTAPVYTGAGTGTRICTFTQPYDDDDADGTYHVVSLSIDIEDY